MKSLVSSKQIVLLAVVSLSAIAASASTATAAYQHRVYPGSDSATTKQSREARLAPNMYCNKHENECQ